MSIISVILPLIAVVVVGITGFVIYCIRRYR